MNKFKSLFKSVFDFLEKRESDKQDVETINLLMKLIFSKDTVKAVELKKQFDKEFLEVLTQRKYEIENNLKAIKSYEN